MCIVEEVVEHVVVVIDLKREVGLVEEEPLEHVRRDLAVWEKQRDIVEEFALLYGEIDFHDREVKRLLQLVTMRCVRLELNYRIVDLLGIAG